MASLISRFFRFSMGRIQFFAQPNLSIPEQRARIDRVTRFARAPRGVVVEQTSAGGVPAEWVIPAAAQAGSAILYIHGGAWIICSPATHRAMVGHIARASGVRALSIDYRLAPEHPFPAHLDDCLAAYRWLLGQGIAPTKIVIAGDSAGGNLTLATLLALRDAGEPLPAAAVCLSPATDLASTGESARTRANVEVLLKGMGKDGLNVVPLYAAGHDVLDPLISPLYGDLRGLPPILIHVGDHEILLDDSTRFAERACAAGVDARVVVWPEMWHVFQMHAPAMPEARASIRQIGEFIQEKIR